MKTLNVVKDMVPSEFKAALHAKCPKCRTGNMFTGPMYSFGTQKMNPSCPHCNFTFEIEPGYFYVAMFVSYAMNVAEMVTLAIATSVLTGSTSRWLYISILLGRSCILSPYHFRYSRVILLYWLTPAIHYDPKRRAMHSE